MNLYAELRRHNVIRVGVACAVSAWLLIQVAETTFRLFGFDEAPAATGMIAIRVFINQNGLNRRLQRISQNLAQSRAIQHEFLSDPDRRIKIADTWHIDHIFVLTVPFSCHWPKHYLLRV